MRTVGDQVQELKSKEATKLASPWMWDGYPFVRVERRSKDRHGQPICVVFADDTGHVRPSVYLVEGMPPEDFDPESNAGFHYVDFEALVDDGWRIVST